MLNHQPQSLVLNLINEALRDAANAPTIIDALDVTGEALRILADLVRVEVRQ